MEHAEPPGRARRAGGAGGGADRLPARDSRALCARHAGPGRGTRPEGPRPWRALSGGRARGAHRVGPLVAAHPLKRLGTPEDVARAALFLASEESAWITGVILDVAGGAVLAR
ncbi:MAG: SDR family oxidoreductase [Archangium sp.]